MKRMFILLMAMLLVLSINSMVLADEVSPFTDVPIGHWAYGAVDKLAKAGIIDGYGDGTFRGPRLMTRFEMAQLVARAMARSDKADAEKKALIDKLALEFAAELKILGVRVANLEDKTKIALNYESRIRYLDYMYTWPNQPGVHYRNGSARFDWRQRIYFSGPVNDQVTFGARLSTGDVQLCCDAGNVTGSGIGFDQMYFNIKDFIGDNLTVGRYSTVGVTNGLLNAKDYDNDGIKLTKQLGSFLFSGLWSVQSPYSEVGLYNLDFRPDDNLKFNLAYQVGNWTQHSWFNQPIVIDEETKSADIGTQMKLGGLYLTGEWVRTRHSGMTDNGYAFQVTNGSTGYFYPAYNLVDPWKAHTDAFAVSYRKLNSYATPGGLSAFNVSSVGWNLDWDMAGYYYTYQNVLSKDVVLTLEYQDLKDVSDEQGDKTWNASFQCFF